MNKPVCILVAGRAGVGKDTAAQYLYGRLENAFSTTIAHFAYGLKQVAYSMGWDGVKDEKGRRLLQDIGKVGREYDINCWCKYTFEKTLPELKGWPFDFVIVPDWRFPNEKEYVRSMGYDVWTLRVEAPEREMLKGTERYNDVSEISLPSGIDFPLAYGYVIGNSGTREELHKQLDDLLITEEIFRR